MAMAKLNLAIVVGVGACHRAHVMPMLGVGMQVHHRPPSYLLLHRHRIAVAGKTQWMNSLGLSTMSWPATSSPSPMTTMLDILVSCVGPELDGPQALMQWGLIGVIEQCNCYSHQCDKTDNSTWPRHLHFTLF